MATNPEANKILQDVKQGMQVVDANGEDVGNVEFVHFTDPGAATNEPEPAEGGLIQKFVEAFTGESDDDEMDERLRRQGYIRIDKGVFGDNKFVSSLQVAEVRGDVVHLSVTKDGLVD